LPVRGLALTILLLKGLNMNYLVDGQVHTANDGMTQFRCKQHQVPHHFSLGRIVIETDKAVQDDVTCADCLSKVTADKYYDYRTGEMVTDTDSRKALIKTQHDMAGLDFFPWKGRCFSCGIDLVELLGDKLKTSVITGCPSCQASFVS
jgi:hypothetical protein